MDYLGRATNIKLTTKINGTHTLTFQMVNSFFDSEKGEYVKNVFIDQVYNERKIKLKYDNEWYEFYIKTIQESKKGKTYLKNFTCSDAFIDELARNGYGIIFDETLYNNVEEIGTFVEEVLEDSIWYYSPENNWGDFTEYIEEKMYKIPVNLFKDGITGYELNYDIKDAEEKITNVFTGERRKINMSDDLARAKNYYWDQYSEDTTPKNSLCNDLKEIENDGYIYVFFSCLGYCYNTEKETDYSSTRVIQSYGDKSYALAPQTVDPNYLIQFMAFPKDAELEIDESGMIMNNNYHYVMTLKQWNEKIKDNSDYFYEFDSLKKSEKNTVKFLKKDSSKDFPLISGNWCVYYDGLLDMIGDQPVLTAKKISIKDRTEINVSKEIDQYVKVYNNHYNENINENKSKYNFLNIDGQWIDAENKNYRLCSFEKTRQIVPQLSRNLIENAIHIKSEDGWGIGAMTEGGADISATIKFIRNEIKIEDWSPENPDDRYNTQDGALRLTPSLMEYDRAESEKFDAYNAFINFGIVGQEQKIIKDKTYCLGIRGIFNSDDKFVIGNGGIVSNGYYDISQDSNYKYPLSIKWSDLAYLTEEKKFFEDNIILWAESLSNIDSKWIKWNEERSNKQNLAQSIKNIAEKEYNQLESTLDSALDLYQQILKYYNKRKANSIITYTYLPDSEIVQHPNKGNLLRINKLFLSKIEGEDSITNIKSVTINNKVYKYNYDYCYKVKIYSSDENNPLQWHWSNEDMSAGSEFYDSDADYRDPIFNPSGIDLKYKNNNDAITPSAVTKVCVYQNNYASTLKTDLDILKKYIATIIKDIGDNEKTRNALKIIGYENQTINQIIISEYNKLISEIEEEITRRLEIKESIPLVPDKFKKDELPDNVKDKQLMYQDRWDENIFTSKKLSTKYFINNISFKDVKETLIVSSNSNVQWHYTTFGSGEMSGSNFHDFGYYTSISSIPYTYSIKNEDDSDMPSYPFINEKGEAIQIILKRKLYLDELRDSLKQITEQRDNYQEQKIDISKYYWYKLLTGENKDEYIETYEDITNLWEKRITNAEDEFDLRPEKEGFILFQIKEILNTPYFAIILNNDEKEKPEDAPRILKNAYLFEAYTKGIDQFDEDDIKYKYSGRNVSKENFFDQFTQPDGEKYIKTSVYSESEIRKYILFENDIMSGDTYGYQEYFIQQIYPKQNPEEVEDTFSKREFLSVEGENMQNIGPREAPYSRMQYSEDDLIISTKYVDLNNCPYYHSDNQDIYSCDCGYNNNSNPQDYCMYQKYGYCPYLFESEKHCRKVRTLKAEKSNRFNLTQEISKIFEAYPIYWNNHSDTGKIKKSIIDNIEVMDKKIFYIKEKGKKNQLGFRYGINLSDITRNIKSDQIVTKLYVLDVDSQIPPTGLCTIKLAEENPSRDNYIIDFSYYIAKNILSEEEVTRDLYGIDIGDMAYYKKIGMLNKEYDTISNLIINLSGESFVELEANINTIFDGILTAQQQLIKLNKQLDKYKGNNANASNRTIENYKTKIKEQTAILNQLIKELLCNEIGQIDNSCFENKRWQWYDIFKNYTVEQFKESPCVKDHKYICGMLGQYNQEYLQLSEWKKIQAQYLDQINKINLSFYRKYEPFLKEGTWSDSNYLTDSAYYFGALDVSAQGAIPKVEYTINVGDISALPKYQDYKFNIADITYVEDSDFFGINPKTGMANKLKVLISEISYDLDIPKNNQIKIQNFTTQFEDLFQQVSASVQSLSFNENIYKRSSNFTSNQNIKEDSLQGTLDKNNMTFINTQEANIVLDSDGQSGSDINNHSNKYKLNGQGLFFSNNGGESWNVGVGPGGINADYIKVGTLDAGKIRIMDNDYLYFYWDKEGLTALREPTSNTDQNFGDFSLFNRYGLSIVEKNQIRLRCGYSFNGEKGYYPSENRQGSDVGFYLYNDKGNPIFSTSSSFSNSNDDEDISARLSLVGEIFATDAFTGDNNYEYKDGYTITSHTCYQIDPTPQDLNQFNNYKTDDGKTLLEDIIFKIDEGKNFQNVLYKEGSEKVPENMISYYLSQRIFYFRDITGVVTAENGYELKVYKGYIKLEDGAELLTGEYLKKENLIEIEAKKYDIIRIGEKTDNLINSDSKKENKTLIFYVKDNEIYQKKEIEGYWIISNVYYLDREKIATDDNQIGVFINNKAINKNAMDGIYQKRVFSCVNKNAKDETNLYNNIMTITSSGELFLGGKIRGKKAGTLSEYSDYVNFDSSSNGESIRILKEQDGELSLWLGNKKLTQWLYDLEESIKKNNELYVKLSTIYKILFE